MIKLLSNPWVTVGIVVALAVGGFYFGQKYADNQCIAASAVSQIASTEESAELAALRLANSQYEERLIKAGRDVEANKALSQQYINEADAAAQRARELERQLLTKDKEWKRKFADTMGNPKCAELMALEVCPLAPMP